MPSTTRRGIGPPVTPFTVTWFRASWIVLTSSGILRASGPCPTGLEIAIGPAPVGNVDVEMQDPTAGITRKVLIIAQILLTWVKYYPGSGANQRPIKRG